MKLHAKSLALVGVLALLAGCHKQVAVAHPPAPPPAPAMAKSTPPESQPAATPVAENHAPTTPDAATKARIQDLLNRIQDVYFDYDQHNLRPDAQSTLQADATTLRQILDQYPNYKLTIEGFCDERGSDAFNMALGDERVPGKSRLTVVASADRQFRQREAGMHGSYRSLLAAEPPGAYHARSKRRLGDPHESNHLYVRSGSCNISAADGSVAGLIRHMAKPNQRRAEVGS
jgi:peptidoglycan-associated lipoprotein